MMVQYFFNSSTILFPITLSPPIIKALVGDISFIISFISLGSLSELLIKIGYPFEAAGLDTLKASANPKPLTITIGVPFSTFNDFTILLFVSNLFIPPNLLIFLYPRSLK